MTPALIAFISYLRGFHLASLFPNEALDAFETLRDAPAEALALVLGSRDGEGKFPLATFDAVTAEVARVLGRVGDVVADAVPASKPAWEGQAEACAQCGKVDGRPIIDGCCGRRVHAICAPVPASEFAGVAWADAELDDIEAFANSRTGHSAKNRDVTRRILAGADQFDDWNKYARQRARAIIAARTPTREEVEASVSLVGDPLRRLVPWDHLGWTEKEWWAYDREGTIPARPLRKHPPAAGDAYDARACADCRCSHLVGCGCDGVPVHPWRKRVEAPKPPGWTILGSHAGDLRCATCGARHGTEPVIEFVRAHEAHGREPAPPAVTIPRPGDEREKAIEALTGCEHARITGLLTASGTSTTVCDTACFDCGALRERKSGKWTRPSLVAALVRS